MTLVTWPSVTSPVTAGGMVRFASAAGSTLEDGGAPYLPVLLVATGLVSDYLEISDAAITAVDTTLTSASNPWTAADVGKPIAVHGAGAAGATLFTTIASFTNPGEVELTAAAGTTVSGAVAAWGTDNQGALQAAVDAVSALGGGTVFVEGGNYLVASHVKLESHVVLTGTALGSTLGTNFIVCANAYAIKFDPGDSSVVQQVFIRAAGKQASGGAIDFTDAEGNARVTDVIFGHYLNRSLNVQPNAARSSFFFERLQWNDVLGHAFAIVLGDGTNVVSNVYIRDLIGSAATTADMTGWLFVFTNVTNVRIVSTRFKTCGNNVFLFGNGSAGTLCSDISVLGCLAEAASAYGFRCDRVRNLYIGGGSTAKTCERGVFTTGNSRAVTVDGASLLENTIYGAFITAGALYTRITNCVISDNNTSDNANGDGISVTANTLDFYITENLIGNNLLFASGHQKYGVRVPSGTSDNYFIQSNRFSGNETAAILDSGSGSNKVVADNI